MKSVIEYQQPLNERNYFITNFNFKLIIFLLRRYSKFENGNYFFVKSLLHIILDTEVLTGKLFFRLRTE